MAVSVSDLVVDTLASLAYALHEVRVHIEQDIFGTRSRRKNQAILGSPSSLSRHQVET
jgi:hypothetical protein